MNTHTEVSTPKILISKRDAAVALSLSIRTIENLIARKELIARRVGRRTLVVASSLKAFARRDHPSPPRTDGANNNGAQAEDVHP
jgi:excisionase family DNA binding protein